MFTNLNRTFILATLLTLSIVNTFAQYDCPSKLASKLKPIQNTGLAWSTEYIASAGALENLEIYSQMVFAGLDFTKNAHNIYAEGGLKNWIRNDTNGYTNTMTTLGLREAFYKYQNENFNLTLGLQSARSDDYYLMNERMSGLGFTYRTRAFESNLKVGSVQKRFARNGTFCTVGYLYNMVPGRDRAVLGNKPGETNFALYTLSFFPSEYSDNTEAGGDEFGNQTEFSESPSEFSGTGVSNEFGTAEEVSSKPSLKPVINKAGALAYTEFGDWVETPFYMVGVYDELGLMQNLKVKTELMYQHAKTDKALIYVLSAEQQFNYGSQQTKLYANYTGLLRIDTLAMALNSYSNLFAGEVLRLDALELPLCMAGVKHSFSKYKTSVRLQYAQQCPLNTFTALETSRGKKGKQMQEIDIIATTNFLNYFQLMLQCGYINYNYLAHDYVSNTKDWYKQTDTFFSRVEFRFTF